LRYILVAEDIKGCGIWLMGCVVVVIRTWIPFKLIIARALIYGKGPTEGWRRTLRYPLLTFDEFLG
jgi:hypothetical protein